MIKLSLLYKKELNTKCLYNAVTGSAFHSADDLEDPDLWEEGSRDPETQQASRIEMLQRAQWIIPRYGPPFRVPDSFKSEMKVVMTP